MRASNIVSDLSPRKLHSILKQLIVGGFTAVWKTGEDPDNCGEKVFGHDDYYPFEYVQEFLDYMSCLYLSHTKLETDQAWAKNDLHPVMHYYKESGKNLVRCVFIVFN